MARIQKKVSSRALTISGKDYPPPYTQQITQNSLLQLVMKTLHSAFFIAIATTHLHSAPLSAVYRNLVFESDFIPFDYDNDGDLDIIATTPQAFTSSPASSAVYYNNGDQSFDGPYVAAYHNTSIGNTMLFGRLENNDTPSIFRLYLTRHSSTDWQYNFIQYSYEDKHSIAQGTRLPLFPSRTEPVLGHDFDQDGFIDLILDNVNEDRLSISWGNNGGIEYLTEPSMDASLPYPRQSSIVDLDHNGLDDIITKNEEDINTTLNISKQISARNFTPPQVLRHVDNSPVLDKNWTFTDLDGDQLPDIYLISEKNFTYCLQTPNGFTLSTTIPHTHKLTPIIGIQPIPGKESKIIYLYQNESYPLAIHSVPFNSPDKIVKQEFEASLDGADTILRASPSPTQKLYDIDQDGHLDILLSIQRKDPWAQRVQSSAAPSLLQLCIGFGQDDGSFLFSWQGFSPISPFLKINGQFIGDEIPDFIMGSQKDKKLTLISYTQKQGWQRQRTLDELIPQTYQQQGISIDSASAIDIDQDGYTDLHITLSKPTNNTLENSSPDLEYHSLIALNDGNGNFNYTSPLPKNFGTETSMRNIFTYADWDNDGDLDAFTSDIGWHENKNGQFSPFLYFLISPGTTTDALGQPISVTGQISITDIDGDGALDLVVPITGISRLDYTTIPATRSPTQMTILFGNGSGGVSEIKSYPIALLASDALGNPITTVTTFFDLNLDGRLDLIYDETISDALGNPLGITHVIYNSADGRFNNLTPINHSNAFYGMVKGDYNGDDILDLIGFRGYTTPTRQGLLKSPAYNIEFEYDFHWLTQAFDIDNDHDDDFFFIPKFYHLSKEGLYCFQNPMVDSNNPAVRYALDAGLMADETLPDADPENDGHSNLVEYMFGGQPSLIDDSSILPQLGTSNHSGQPQLTATFKQRSQLPPGKQYHLRISNDLESWIDYPLGHGTTTPIDSTWQQFSITIDPTSLFPNGSKAFIKWDVQ